MNPELFLLPHQQDYVLYAPLSGLMAVVNQSAGDAVAQYLDGEALDENQQSLLDTLGQRGFLRDDLVPPAVPQNFEPTRVTLFPSDACNLRCRYCYASAEAGQNRLPQEVAFAAIDTVAQNAKRLGQPMFGVGFHGNGEPFTNFECIQACCEYATQLAEDTGLKVHISTATNGVLSAQRLDYALAYIKDFNVSCDVLPDIQNAQRPFPDGSGTFEAVDATLQRLNAAEVSFGIRATLTTQSVGRIREMAAFVKEHYPRCNMLHLEPAWEVGRALETGQKTPQAETFVQQYILAEEELAGTRIKLVYSGARRDILAASFCSVCRNSFTVTAEGNVTSCYEVCTTKDARSPRYLFGHYDFDKHDFVFDEAKLEALAKLEVRNMPYCGNCFCKWHCAGDCAAKLLGTASPAAHAGSDRCYINRELTRRQIFSRMGLVAAT